MISDTDSDDDLMMPNGFVDLGADKVQCDFESGTSPPLKKKCVQKKKSQSSNSLGSSQTEPIEAAVLPFSTTETEGLHSWEPIVLETTDDTAENRGPRRSKRITKSSYSSKPTSKKTSFTRSYNESTIVLNSGEASPEVLNDVSTSLQSSFCFDEEDVSIHTAEESPIDDEVKVRVVWKGCETHTFTLRKFQKIKEIYTHFAKQEGVEEDRILFTLRDKPVGPQDSPSTLNIGVTFLEGGVTDVVSSNRVNQNVDSESPGDPNALKLFVQRRGLRDKHTVFTYRHEKISILISKLTEELKIPNGSFKLVFDGDALEINKTPEDYDMEGDECIDLIET